MRREDFIPEEFGWVSSLTPPTIHNNVVVLIFLVDESLYVERFGFFENGEWIIDEEDKHTIKGWFPYPYTPDNN